LASVKDKFRQSKVSKRKAGSERFIELTLFKTLGRKKSPLENISWHLTFLVDMTVLRDKLAGMHICVSVPISPEIGGHKSKSLVISTND
jgi:hypothetical protein